MEDTKDRRIKAALYTAVLNKLSGYTKINKYEERKQCWESERRTYFVIGIISLLELLEI